MTTGGRGGKAIGAGGDCWQAAISAFVNLADYIVCNGEIAPSCACSTPIAWQSRPPVFAFLDDA